MASLVNEKNKRPAPPVRLQVEELEGRTLLSASGLAQPNLSVEPSNWTSTQPPYTVAQIRQAYGVTPLLQAGINGRGQTIAIVDAYGDPNLSSDLAQFDSKMGLPAANLTIATPGGAVANNSSWAMEISLDVEWAHAIAPNAKILLVEAPSANDSALLSAVQYAAKQPGVVAVSMSWGGSEFSGEISDDSAFTTPSGHPGVAFVASAGDSGAANGPEWPASSPNVLAVGGSSLHLTSSGSYSSEQGWSNGGGGHSAYEREPAFQDGAQSSGFRTTPDVAYDAAPGTGYYIYDTDGHSGWLTVGGTSAGAPQWAAIVALADQERGSSLTTSQVVSTLYGVYRTSAYSNDFHDITSGSNGYSAATGYDLVTGLGSPKVNNIVPLLAHATATTSLIAAPSSTSGGTGSTAPAVRGSNRLAGLPLMSPPVGSAITENEVLALLHLVAPEPRAALAENNAASSDAYDGSASQSSTVFGASGWSGTESAWRLSSHGLPAAHVDRILKELASAIATE